MTNPTPEPLRGAIVGLGAMGANHLRVALTLPDLDVRAVVDPDPERRARATAGRPGLSAYATLDEAIAAHELDVVCLAAPVGFLPGLAATALGADLHVLVEKPAAPTEAEAQAMVEQAEARNLVLAVGYIERCNPAVVALKQKLEDGVIGRVLQMNARRLSPFPNRQGSQGVALDLTTHDIDVMRFVTGHEVARVQGETTTLLADVPEHEDVLSAVVRFDDETVGILETAWTSPTKIRQLTVMGEGGMLTVDYLTQDLVLSEYSASPTEWDQMAAIRGGREGNVVRFALDRREPLRVEWENFLRAARGEADGTVSGRDGLATLSTALAIRQAAREHTSVVPGYRTLTTG